jgi:hypothetical protein
MSTPNIKLQIRDLFMGRARRFLQQTSGSARTPGGSLQSALIIPQPSS